jgi:hypothetical protein
VAQFALLRQLSLPFLSLFFFYQAELLLIFLSCDSGTVYRNNEKSGVSKSIVPKEYDKYATPWDPQKKCFLPFMTPNFNAEKQNFLTKVTLR